jgi:hypothetical protein
MSRQTKEVRIHPGKWRDRESLKACEQQHGIRFLCPKGAMPGL